jgi:hypothetical protein
MKKLQLSLTILLICAISTVTAQIEITPQVGYQIGSKYSYNGGYIKLKSSEQFGVTTNIDLNDDGAQAEIMYTYQNAELRVQDIIFYPVETFISDVNTHHFQFGFIQNFNFDEELRPFAGISGGFTVFDPTDSFYDSRTKFAIGLTGGMKYFFSDLIGVRLQAQLLMPIEWGGVYYTTGGGVITTGGTLVQLNFSGGLIFRLE